MGKNLIWIWCLFAAPVWAGDSDCAHLLDLSALDSRSATFWRRQQESYRFNTREVLSQYYPEFLAMKAAGDPYIAYLESLGFQFLPELSIPDDLRALVERVNAKAAGFEQRGFRAIRLVEWVEENGPRGGVSVRGVGDVLHGDAGVTPEIADIATIGRNFSRNVVAGYFPAGTYDRSILGRGNTGFLHNLGHMMSIQDNPEIYDLILRKMEHLRNLRSSGKISLDEFKSLRHRFFLLFETLSVIPRNNREAAISLLNVPPHYPERSLIAMESHLETMTDGDLTSLAKTLISKVPPLINRIGGCLSGRPYIHDLAMKRKPELTRGYFSGEENQAYHVINQSTFDDVWVFLRRDLAAVNNLEVLPTELRRQLISSLARFQQRVLDLSKVDEETWVNDLISEVEVPQGSVLRRYFGHGSGFSQESEDFFQHSIFMAPKSQDLLENPALSFFQIQTSTRPLTQLQADILGKADAIRGANEPIIRRNFLKASQLSVKDLNSPLDVTAAHWKELLTMLKSSDFNLKYAAIVMLAHNPLDKAHRSSLAWPAEFVGPLSESMLDLVSEFRSTVPPKREIASASLAVLANQLASGVPLPEQVIRSLRTDLPQMKNDSRNYFQTMIAHLLGKLPEAP